MSAAVALVYLLVAWPLWHIPAAWLTGWLVLGLAVFSLATLIDGGRAARDLGRPDPPQVVSDEAAGMCLALLGAAHAIHPAFAAGAAFVFFRVFDILKPLGIRRLEKLPGGLGILLDDLAAALPANALTWMFFWIARDVLKWHWIALV